MIVMTSILHLDRTAYATSSKKHGGVPAGATGDEDAETWDL
jgi:hypothetical protein